MFRYKNHIDRKREKIRLIFIYMHIYYVISVTFKIAYVLYKTIYKYPVHVILIDALKLRLLLIKVTDNSDLKNKNLHKEE